MNDNQCSGLDKVKRLGDGECRPCPPIEDHVGEELFGDPCQAEVTQEHIRQLREVIILQQYALAVVQRAMFDFLPSGDSRVEELNEYLNVQLPWVK